MLFTLFEAAAQKPWCTAMSLSEAAAQKPWRTAMSLSEAAAQKTWRTAMSLSEAAAQKPWRTAMPLSEATAQKPWRTAMPLSQTELHSANNKAFALLGRCAAWVGIWSPTFCATYQCHLHKNQAAYDSDISSRLTL